MFCLTQEEEEETGPKTISRGRAAPKTTQVGGAFSLPNTPKQEGGLLASLSPEPTLVTGTCIDSFWGPVDSFFFLMYPENNGSSNAFNVHKKSTT